MEKWIERQKHIIDFTLSSLLRRKGKNAALIIVYTFVIFMLASVVFFVQAIKREASIILQDSPDLIIQRMSAGRHELIPVSYGDRIQSIRGISAVKSRLWGYYYDSVTGANYTFMVSQDPRVSAGRIVIGAGVARARIAFAGDTIEFRAYDGAIIDLEVKGTINSQSELVSSDLILVSGSDFRRLFRVPAGYATDLTAKVRNPKERPMAALKVASLLPDTRQILREEILRTYDAAFNWRGGMIIVILSGMLMAFLILAWDKASGLSSEERREIGILKAIGWETSDVLLLKFWEGMILSLSSLFSGILLAYAHVFFTSSFLFEPALKGWAVLYPRFKVAPFIDPFQLATLCFLAVVPYIVATIIPVWRTATVDPDSVMR